MAQGVEGGVEAGGGDLLKIEFLDLGCCPYHEAHAWQKRLAAKRKKGLIEDHLLLLEHPPVITFGKRDAEGDLLVSRSFLRQGGIEVVATDRGGKITYHGPGQLVAYFIFHLRGMTVPDFVHRVEDILIGMLDEYQIVGERDAKNPGVWVGSNKIAAVGFHIDHQVTTHGIALNVNCDLRPFRYFHPCGILDRGVTSLEKELGWHPPMQEVKHSFLYHTMRVFHVEEFAEGVFSSAPE